MSRRILIKIEYCGENYAGWQIQKGLPTVQADIQKGLAILYQQFVRLDGTSRTDAGVHARWQLAVFDEPYYKDLTRIWSGLNALTRADISIVSVQEVASDYHPRLANIGKRYIYRVFNRRTKPSIGGQYYWHLPYRLDMQKMAEAAEYILKLDDFEAFRGKNCQATSTKKKLWRLSIKRESLSVQKAGSPSQSLAGIAGVAGSPHQSVAGVADSPHQDVAGVAGSPHQSVVGIAPASSSHQGIAGVTPVGRNKKQVLQINDAGYNIDFIIEGNSFLKQMVRIIVGTIIDVGLGQLSLQEVIAGASQGERWQLGQTAPSCGLILDEIFLPKP